MNQTIKTIQTFISIFENETLTPDYASCENIGDGRGFTSGCAGWVTKWGDYLNVTSKYKPLSKFTSKIYVILKMQGFQKAWVNACKDPLFCAIQDQVQYTQYFLPAINAGQRYGVISALGKLVLCDTAIQHGMEDDSDTSPGLATMLSRAKGASEQDFLLSLLEVRRRVLLSNGSVWAGSVGRVDVLENLVHATNFSLILPITINPFGKAFTIS